MTAIKDNGTICMLPWIHLFALPDGRAYPCCETPWQSSVGDLRESSLIETWNSPGMRQLRSDMILGIENGSCSRCHELERIGMRSTRQKSLLRWADHMDRIAQTKSDGSVSLHMAYLDVRFSNLCNLRCRTCGPISSSAWHDDAKVVYPDDKTPRYLRIDADGDFMRQLMPHLSQVEMANFAGGEPLMMEEHYRILQHWIDIGRTDIELTYTTNFTQLGYKDQDLFYLWSHFPNVSVSASLDGSNSHAEYIRHGTRWPDILRNRDELRDRCAHVRFEITTTVSVYNINHVFDFHREMVSSGMIQIDGIELNPLVDPKWLCVRVLPADNKREIAERCHAHMEWLQSERAAPSTVSGFKLLVDFMYDQDWSDQLTSMRQFTTTLDGLRGESASASLTGSSNLFRS